MQIINTFFQGKGKVGSVDMEAIEMAVRSSVHSIGKTFLEEIVNADKGGYRGRVTPCDRGHRYEFVEYREKSFKVRPDNVCLHGWHRCACS